MLGYIDYGYNRYINLMTIAIKDDYCINSMSL